MNNFLFFMSALLALVGVQSTGISCTSADGKCSTFGDSAPIYPPECIGTPLNIIIRPAADGPQVNLAVYSLDSIYSVEDSIIESDSTYTHFGYGLTYNQVIMDESKTLSDYNIPDGAALTWQPLPVIGDPNQSIQAPPVRPGCPFSRTSALDFLHINLSCKDGGRFSSASEMVAFVGPGPCQGKSTSSEGLFELAGPLSTISIDSAHAFADHPIRVHDVAQVCMKFVCNNFITKCKCSFDMAVKFSYWTLIDNTVVCYQFDGKNGAKVDDVTCHSPKPIHQLLTCDTYLCPRMMHQTSLMRKPGLPPMSIYCSGVTCTTDECCMQNPLCQMNHKCPDGTHAASPNLPKICAAMLCEDSECCVPNPTCGAGFRCAHNFVKKEDSNATCQGSTCTNADCCVPVLTCQSFSCAAVGRTNMPTRQNAHCQHQVCSAAYCCEPLATCKMFRCAVGYVKNPVVTSQNKPCSAPICTATECCQAKALCNNFKCPSGSRIAHTEKQCSGVVCRAGECCARMTNCALHKVCLGPSQVEKPNPQSILCATATCAPTECCDMHSPVKVCSTYLCPQGFVMIANSDNTICTEGICTTNACCSKLETCTSNFICPAATSLLSPPGTGSAPLKVGDCCAPNQTCKSYTCGYGFKVDGNDLDVCMGLHCTDADCCKVDHCYLHETNCLAQGKIVDPSKAQQACHNASCDDSDACCIVAGVCTDSFKCSDAGMTLSKDKVNVKCLGAICVDTDCCVSEGNCQTDIDKGWVCPGGSVFHPARHSCGLSKIGEKFEEEDDNYLQCIEAACCTLNQNCNTYTCTNGLLKSESFRDAQCTQEACTDEDCCVSPDTCIHKNGALVSEFKCPTDMRIKNAGVGLPISCVAATCTVDECCYNAPTCDNYTCPSLYSKRTFLATDANPCKGDGCTTPDCCVLNENCFSLPDIMCNKKTPPTGQQYTKRPKFNFVCPSLKCEVDDCCMLSSTNPSIPTPPTPVPLPFAPTPINVRPVSICDCSAFVCNHDDRMLPNAKDIKCNTSCSANASIAGIEECSNKLCCSVDPRLFGSCVMKVDTALHHASCPKGTSFNLAMMQDQKCTSPMCKNGDVDECCTTRAKCWEMKAKQLTNVFQCPATHVSITKVGKGFAENEPITCGGPKCTVDECCLTLVKPSYITIDGKSRNGPHMWILYLILSIVAIAAILFWTKRKKICCFTTKVGGLLSLVSLEDDMANDPNFTQFA